MKAYPFVSLSFTVLSIVTMLLTACSSPSGDPPSRSEYEYVPPPMIRPSPTPAPPEKSPDNAEAESGQETKEKKPSFFARLFAKKDKGDKNEATVARVGDTVEMKKNEDGELVEKGKPTDNVYRLKTGDTLFISLSGSGGLNEEIETVIDDEGAIKLRYIGSVKGEGLSSTELEREIEAEYTERQKIYKDVTVRVVVPNTFYFIGGEVRQPGRFPLVGRVTLSQAVVSAGNFTEWADESDVILVRNNERVMINFKKIKQNPNLDVELLAGDVITVERSTF